MYLTIWVSPEISPKPETSGSSVSLAILSARGWCFRLWWEWRQIFILHSPCFASCFAHMIFGKHQRDIRLEGRMTPDQSMAADFLGQPRHAEGFLGRYIYIYIYIFSGFPWYAGGFQRYCFYSCIHGNWLGSEKQRQMTAIPSSCRDESLVSPEIGPKKVAAVSLLQCWAHVVDASDYDENGGRFWSFTPTVLPPVLRTWFLESLETLETVPGVLQQPCYWHFVQENARIERHGLGK